MFQPQTPHDPRPPLTPRDVYELRRWRDAHATGQHFGEPAWDMLLQLAMEDDRGAVPAHALGAAFVATEPRRLELIEDLVRGGLVARLTGGGQEPAYLLSGRGRAFMDAVFGQAPAVPRA